MKILFISLGCDKNLTDAEQMIGKLNKDGYVFTDDENDADIIIINTCCFINDAKEESINTILEMAQYKQCGKCKGLIVCGCLAERYKDEIIKEIPEVDAIFGTASIDRISEAADTVSKGGKFNKFDSLTKNPVFNSERVITTGGYYGYLKIAEGCDKRCTYCIIPSIRGSYRSVPIEEVLGQADMMVRNGVKEIILIAQETTLYGVDLYGGKLLHILLRKLSEIDGLKWIRIMYCYPEEIYDELIYEIRDNDKICKYLDIPIQHGSDSVLKSMGRKTNRSDIINIVNKLRNNIPDIILRTTLISGFPGETDKDHEILKEFVRDMQFDRLGVFEYSCEEDTPAAKMKNQVPEDIKESRRGDIMEIQQEIAFEKAEQKIGRIFDVIIEGRIADENAYIGRTYMDAPEIDGNIFVVTDEELMSGDFVKAKVIGAAEYDLISEIWREK